MKVRIYTGTRPSAAAQTLAAALAERGIDSKRIKTAGSRYRPRPNHFIINYGSSEVPPEFMVAAGFNGPEAVAKAVNKLESYQAFIDSGLRVPEYTENRRTADDKRGAWKYGYLCRTTMTGSGGEGISYHSSENVPPEVMEGKLVKLYMQYIRKTAEYRVHVFDGQVIDLQKKRRRTGEDGNPIDANPFVRNLENGWVFCRDNVTLPDEYKQAAIDAVQALGLDFGAVDLITTSRSCYILEVNTAPGLEGATINSYADAVVRLLDEVNGR